MKLSHYVVPAVALAAAISVRADTLTSVPMQGPMVHVNIKYADHGAGPHLHVHVDGDDHGHGGSSTLPTLTPLSISHPGDQFDPLAPWYSDLDPSQDGRAFNRQYGFVLDGDSEPLPTGFGIRIRQISATTGLEAFRYRATPATWEPMFGTDGSSDTLEWNLGMFHPAYTAPAATGMHSAEYEAYIVNENGERTGGSETFHLHWAVVPEPTTALLTAFGLLGAGWLRRRLG